MLSKLSGVSRRTLARIEARSSRHAKPAVALAKAGLSNRTTMRLIRLLLPPDRIDTALSESTKLSRGYAAQLGGSPDAYRLLDLLPDPYPSFLFHPPQNELDNFIRQEFAPDYRDSLHRLVLRPPRNLGLRLRAFRLRHDLTLVQTADLPDLSKSQLHRLERSERHPSAQTAYKILRLLTFPHPPNVGEGLACPERRRRAGTESPPVTSHESPVTDLFTDPLDSLRHFWLSGRYSTRDLVYPESRLVGTKGRPSSEHAEPLDHVRYLWLSGCFKTRDLASLLGISPPHLIRLLRGDRRPSRKLLARLSATVSTT